LSEKGFIDTPSSCYDRNAFYGSQRELDASNDTASPMSWGSDAESHTDGEDDAKAIVSTAARHLTQHVHTMDVNDIRVAAIREHEQLERQSGERVPCITWYMRLRMAVHIARAVKFLHDQRPAVLRQLHVVEYALLQLVQMDVSLVQTTTSSQRTCWWAKETP
jgi:hypothetical protein